MLIEIRAAKTWHIIDQDSTVRVGETTSVEFRGLPAYANVSIGGAQLQAGHDGTVALRCYDNELLQGHLGLIEVWVNDVRIGELEVYPEKVSENAYLALRSGLERVWAGLVYGDSPAHVKAYPIDPLLLWEQIQQPVHDILANPHVVLRQTETIRRLEQTRRPYQITRHLALASQRGRPGLSRSITQTTSTPENAMVGETLHRLASQARKRPDRSDLARTIARCANDPIFRSSPRNMRASIGPNVDRRYRQIDRVRQILLATSTPTTEGPGDLRLGIRAMHRLYEYWVFLQVLIAAELRYGKPLGDGYTNLAVDIGGNRKRLTLPAGTTVSYPGDVHIAFEPTIATAGSSWKGLELVGHPDPRQFQPFVTPDVVVYRAGIDPWITVIDAKYVARHWVERASADIHRKYARIRVAGRPAVRYVIAAHPHRGLDAFWAGYGNVAVIPGGTEPAEFLLPAPARTPVQSSATDLRIQKSAK